MGRNYAVTAQVTVFGRVDNRFDEKIQDPNGFLRPGSGVFGGVRYATR
jgi:vitamin B12 transporter